MCWNLTIIKTWILITWNIHWMREQNLNSKFPSKTMLSHLHCCIRLIRACIRSCKIGCSHLDCAILQGIDHILKQYLHAKQIPRSSQIQFKKHDHLPLLRHVRTLSGGFLHCCAHRDNHEWRQPLPTKRRKTKQAVHDKRQSWRTRKTYCKYCKNALNAAQRHP